MGDPVPIITVGGFLGAGKTTLVNNILRQSEGQRIVVFVNDFGAINIDFDLIETSDANRVSLKNGCVCCSLNDDLVASIVGFCAETPPDAFVVEASGVADPRALDASIFALQEAGYTQLGARVYVVDADQLGASNYADTETIVDHAAASDLVLVNKSDLVTQTTLNRVEALLARSAPHSKVLVSRFAQIPIPLLWGDKTTEPTDVNSLQQSVLDHGNVYCSWSLGDFPPLPRDRFDRLLDELRRTAMRAKGVLYLENAPRSPMQFDLVGSHVSLRQIKQEGIVKGTRIVAIGRASDLDSERLRHLLTE